MTRHGGRTSTAFRTVRTNGHRRGAAASIPTARASRRSFRPVAHSFSMATSGWCSPTTAATRSTPKRKPFTLYTSTRSRTRASVAAATGRRHEDGSGDGGAGLAGQGAVRVLQGGDHGPLAARLHEADGGLDLGPHGALAELPGVEHPLRLRHREAGE